MVVYPSPGSGSGKKGFKRVGGCSLTLQRASELLLHLGRTNPQLYGREEKNYSQKYIVTSDNLMRKAVGILRPHLSRNDTLKTPM